MSPTSRVSFGAAVVGRSRPLPPVVVAYAVALGLVGFWPRPVDRAFAGVADLVIAALHAMGGPPWLDPAFAERAANVALFVPLGWLVASAARRRMPAHLAVMLAGAVGAVASSLIEFGQAVLLPARVPSEGDVVANLLGALAGAAIVFAISRDRVRDIASPPRAMPTGRARSARR
ncbi:VanZ family protein [Agromyces larvae]|uniref:VanZ family protein n=1 Tax=Agromyces larvae TaxID=2929802 RepID=A0ABY4BYV5_9MICO|nr:VanZ family protein [Agromyces larvae]UOE44343.1 VanZ family protein [Agromyces larvae]